MPWRDLSPFPKKAGPAERRFHNSAPEIGHQTIEVREMMVAVWRASAADFDVKGFLSRYPGFVPDVIWEKGQQRLGSKETEQTSGFNKTVGEADDAESAIAQMRAALEGWRDMLDALRSIGVVSTIDFGMMVNFYQRFTYGLGFDLSAIKELAELGLSLEISVYPASADDEDDD